MFHNLKLPNGERIALDTSKDIDRIKTLREYGLDDAEEFCNDNWLNPGHSFVTSPELKIKNYLGACAGYILQGDSPDTLSRYRERAISKKELPLSQMPATLRDQVYSDDGGNANNKAHRAFAKAARDANGEKKAKPARKKKWPLTRYQKISRLKDELGEIEFLYCGIDTENGFHAEGVAFRVDEAIEEYKPVETRFGVYYPMDHVIVLVHPVTRQILRFCTQNMDVIPDDKIMRGDESWASIVANAVAETSVQPETDVETDMETIIVMEEAAVQDTILNETRWVAAQEKTMTAPALTKDAARMNMITPITGIATPNTSNMAKSTQTGVYAGGVMKPRQQTEMTKHISPTSSRNGSWRHHERERGGTILGCSTECCYQMSSNGFGTPSLARTSASYSATRQADQAKPP